LIQHHLSLLAADGKVAGCEFVGNVPAEGAKAPALLYHSVEESEGIAKLIAFCWLGAQAEKFFVA